MRDFALRRDFHVSASARGVDDELKASLRLHRVLYFLLARLIGWICCVDLLVYREHEDRSRVDVQ